MQNNRSASKYTERVDNLTFFLSGMENIDTGYEEDLYRVQIKKRESIVLILLLGYGFTKKYTLDNAFVMNKVPRENQKTLVYQGFFVVRGKRT